jgi:outer membrane protein TolC
MRTLHTLAWLALGLVMLVPGPALALDMREAVDMALRSSHGLKGSERMAEAAGSAAAAARAGYWPQLSASYAYLQSTEDAYGLTDKTSSLTLTAAYNIFSGMSVQNSSRAARAEAMAAEYQANSARAETVLSARRAYLGVLSAWHARETAREGVELLERQRFDAGLYYREGLIAKNDLLRVELELASTRQEMLRTEGDLSIALVNLESVIGAPVPRVEGALPVEDVTSRPEAAALAFPAMQEEMFARRSELRYIESMRNSYALGARAAGGSAWPRVDVSVSHVLYGEDIAPTGRDLPYGSETVTALTASWKIFDGMARPNTVARLEHLSGAMDEQLAAARDSLTLQLRQTLEGYAIAEGQVTVAEAAISQAEENYRVTESQFKERVATTTDLINARALLSRARSQYYAALYGLHLQAATIERVLER